MSGAVVVVVLVVVAASVVVVVLVTEVVVVVDGEVLDDVETSVVAQPPTTKQSANTGADNLPSILITSRTVSHRNAERGSESCLRSPAHWDTR